MRLATFSIVAKDRKSADFGGASATAAPCVGAFLPNVLEGVGAIASQAWVNVNLGHHGVDLIRNGMGVRIALEALLAEDEGRDRRQVIGVDRRSGFGYTGRDCTDAKGHLIGHDFAVAGNILTDISVLDAMANAFKNSKAEFSQRLLDSLVAGQDAGGDSRGKMSAVLRVSSSKPRLYHDLRVDLSDDPITELARLHGECVALQQEYGDDEDGEELRVRVARLSR